MYTIPLDNWPRKDHYLFFKTFEYPHFSLSVDMDLTDFLPFIKEQKVSFTAAIMYLVARCANGIPEFKHRVRDGDPIVHDVVHPSTTILSKDDLFTFCTVEYQPDFKKFTQSAEEEIALVKAQPYLGEKFPDDRMLFMTSIPWVSFTSFMHPTGVHGTMAPAAPTASLPALTTWNPSTSLSGSTVVRMASVRICAGSGSCTRIP